MIIYRDRAGNTISIDLDARIGIRNMQGELVNPKEAKRFLRKKEVKRALEKHYGTKTKFKVK